MSAILDRSPAPEPRILGRPDTSAGASRAQLLADAVQHIGPVGDLSDGEFAGGNVGVGQPARPVRLTLQQ